MQPTGRFDRGGEPLLLRSPGVAADLDLNKNRPPVNAGDQIAGSGRAEPDQAAMLVLQGAGLIFQDQSAYPAHGEPDAVAAVGVVHAISPRIFALSFASTEWTPHSSHAARNSRLLGLTSPAAASHRLPPCLPRWVH